MSPSHGGGCSTQRLVAPFAGSAHEVIRSLLAVQAENPGQAEWAVAARTRRRDPSDLAMLLDQGKVLADPRAAADLAFRLRR